MDKTLIIFEFADEIDAFISQRSINELKDKNIYVLAILPEAQVYLKRMEIPFHNTYSLFSKKEHENALLKCDNIYKFCDPLLKIEDDLGIKEGYRISLLTYMRVFVNYLLWLIEIVNNACSQWYIGRVIVCCRDDRQIKGPLLDKNEGYLPEIAERASKKYGLACEQLQVKKLNNGPFLNGIKNELNEIARLIFYQINSGFARLRSQNKNTILASSKSYNLDRVVKSFEEAFNDIYTVYLSGSKGRGVKGIFADRDKEGFILLPILLGRKKRSVFLKKLNDILSKLEASASSNNIFAYRGANFSDIVFNKIKKDIIPTLCNFYSQSVYLDKFLKKRRPAMIISQMGRYLHYNLGELASLNNIPSLLISHGSHVPPKNEYEMIEWKDHGLGLMNSHYKYVAVQSPWAKAYLEKAPARGEQIITGPLLFAKGSSGENGKKMLRKRLIPEYEDKIILLHADTPRQRMAMRFFIYQTVDEYLHNINSLIKAVEKTDKYHLIIRFRPLHYLTKEDILPLLIDSDCYSIHSGGTFDEYLAISDMLISYSSTTIEEALQNRVPVLQYDSQGKYCHIEGEVLKPRANPRIDSCYYVNSEDDLPWALEWLAEHHFSGQLPDSLWNRHVFGKSEKIDLPVYFKNLFRNGTSHSEKEADDYRQN